MTVPVAERNANTETLPFQTPPPPAAQALLAGALDTKISTKAFKLYAAIILRGDGEWLSVDAMAELSDFTGHQCRPLAAELVKAGLLARTRRVVGDGAARSVRHRYAVAVGPR